MDIRKVTDMLSVAPQIAPEDMTELAALGFKSVVSNRPDGEEAGQPTAAEMAAAAETAGLAFQHVPVISGAMTADDVVTNAAALDALDGPVLAYCRSGTRSIMLWAQDQIANGKMDADAVIEAGAQAGYNLGPLRR